MGRGRGVYVCAFVRRRPKPAQLGRIRRRCESSTWPAMSMLSQLSGFFFFFWAVPDSVTSYVAQGSIGAVAWGVLTTLEGFKGCN